MKRLIIYFAKRYILDAINTLLAQNKDNVTVICNTVQIWSSRLNAIVKLLESIADKCKDGHIDDDETKKTLEDFNKLIQDFR